MSKVLNGVLIAAVFSALIIMSIEKQYSFYQISFGFLVYLIPAMFIFSFKTRGLAFLITVVSILFAYSSYRFEWHATWVGVLMAFVIGLPIYYYRIRKAKVQDGHKGST
jgi:predicted membrane protein